MFLWGRIGTILKLLTSSKVKKSSFVMTVVRLCSFNVHNRKTIIRTAPCFPGRFRPILLTHSCSACFRHHSFLLCLQDIFLLEVFSPDFLVTWRDLQERKWTTQINFVCTRHVKTHNLSTSCARNKLVTSLSTSL